MHRILVSLFLLMISFSGCDSGQEKSRISEIDRLSSPSGGFNLHRYNIESPMSFGSGFTAINILDSSTVLDPSTGDIFRLGNDSPFWIKWIDDTTLSVKCIKDGLAGSDFYIKGFSKWKRWTFEVEYYSLVATTAIIKRPLEAYEMNKEYLTVKFNGDSIAFHMDEVQLTIDENHLEVLQFIKDSTTNKLQRGIALSHYSFQSNKEIKIKDFIDQQPFIRINQ